MPRNHARASHTKGGKTGKARDEKIQTIQARQKELDASRNPFAESEDKSYPTTSGPGPSTRDLRQGVGYVAERARDEEGAPTNSYRVITPVFESDLPTMGNDLDALVRGLLKDGNEIRHPLSFLPESDALERSEASISRKKGKQRQKALTNGFWYPATDSTIKILRGTYHDALKQQQDLTIKFDPPSTGDLPMQELVLELHYDSPHTQLDHATAFIGEIYNFLISEGCEIKLSTLDYLRESGKFGMKVSAPMSEGRLSDHLIKNIVDNTYREESPEKNYRHSPENIRVRRAGDDPNPRSRQDLEPAPRTRPPTLWM